jgi:hypothetical protein
MAVGHPPLDPSKPVQASLFKQSHAGNIVPRSHSSIFLYESIWLKERPSSDFNREPKVKLTTN